MDFWLWVVIFVIILGIGLGFSYFVARRKKEILRSTLEARGAREIAITWQSWNIDRGNYVYDVTYVDAEGKHHATTCKVEAWGNRIFWEDRP